MPLPLPLLYSYRRCPYAMRARMALLQARRGFAVFDVVLRDKPAELLRLSPKGTVPVLQLPDGTVIDESLDVMRWAFDGHDPDGWWARAQSPDLLDLVRVNDGAFKHHLDRYKYPERFDGAGALHRDAAVDVLLAPLERRLQSATQSGGDVPCAADVAVFPFVRQFAAVDPVAFARLPLPAVQAWLAAWTASDLFAGCMAKVPSATVVPWPAVVR